MISYLSSHSINAIGHSINASDFASRTGHQSCLGVTAASDVATTCHNVVTAMVTVDECYEKQ
jgi:hypothetical protein